MKVSINIRQQQAITVPIRILVKATNKKLNRVALLRMSLKRPIVVITVTASQKKLIEYIFNDSIMVGSTDKFSSKATAKKIKLLLDINVIT